MSALIFKTDITSKQDFIRIQNMICKIRKVDEYTIDLEDVDKVLRILSDSITITEVENEVGMLGFYCKELED